MFADSTGFGQYGSLSTKLPKGNTYMNVKCMCMRTHALKCNLGFLSTIYTGLIKTSIKLVYSL